MPALRLPTGSSAGRRSSTSLMADAELPMRRHHLLDQRGQRQAAHMGLAFGRQGGQPPQDIAAAFALAAQQVHVFAEARILASARAPSPWRRR